MLWYYSKMICGVTVCDSVALVRNRVVICKKSSQVSLLRKAWVEDGRRQSSVQMIRLFLLTHLATSEGTSSWQMRVQQGSTAWLVWLGFWLLVGWCCIWFTQKWIWCEFNKAGLKEALHPSSLEIAIDSCLWNTSQLIHSNPFTHHV